MTGSNQISSWDTLVDLKKIRPEVQERQTDLAKPLPDFLLIFPTICQKNRHSQGFPQLPILSNENFSYHLHGLLCSESKFLVWKSFLRF